MRQEMRAIDHDHVIESLANGSDPAQVAAVVTGH
jgi:hypothetical protein